MAIHCRQICLVAEKLEPTIETLSHVLGINVCYRDHEVGKFGLENGLLAIGSQFIEVVSPSQNNTAAGRFLERRGGDGGYMVICQVPDKEEQAQVKQRAQQQDVRIAYESDRVTWNIMQLHPRDMGAAFLEVDWDEQADMTGNWQPAGGRDWKASVNSESVTAIVAVELQSDDPHQLAQTWAAVTGADLVEEQGIMQIGLANIRIRFVQAQDGRGDGLAGLDIKATNHEAIEARAHAAGIPIENGQFVLCGTRFTLAD